MCLKMRAGSGRSLGYQRGSTLVMAVFVLTVMVLLSGVLIRSLDQETVSVGLETTSTRAWAAAQSGIDWGLARVLNRTDSATNACDAVQGTEMSPGNGLPSLVAFDRCSVNLGCTLVNGHGSDSVTHGFVVTAIASCGADQVRSTRTIDALAYDD